MIIKVTIPHQVQLKVAPRLKSMIFAREGEIHYIGGTEILPPPLNAEEEARAILGLESENGEQARATLIEHNLRLVVYIARKFENTGVGVEDLISIGTIGLIKAINTFNRNKNIKLATYASRCIENEILMYLRRNSKMRMEVSIDEPLNVDWDGNELLLSDILGTDADIIYRDLENEVERKLLKKALSKLSRTRKDYHRTALRTESPVRQRDDTERSGGSYGYFSVLHFQAGKENYRKTEKRNCKI